MYAVMLSDPGAGAAAAGWLVVELGRVLLEYPPAAGCSWCVSTLMQLLFTHTISEIIYHHGHHF